MEIKTRELDKEASIVNANPFQAEYKFLIPEYFVNHSELSNRSLLLAIVLVNYSILTRKLSNNFSFSTIVELGKMPASYSAAPSVFLKKTEHIIEELKQSEITINKNKTPLFSNITVDYNLQLVHVEFSKKVIIALANSSHLTIKYSNLIIVPEKSIKLYFVLLQSKSKNIVIDKKTMYALLNINFSYRPTVVSEKYLGPFIIAASSTFNGLTCTMNLVHKRLKSYEFNWNSKKDIN